MKTKPALVLWAVILCACSTGTTTSQPLPVQKATWTPLPKSSTKIVATFSTPHIDQGPNGEYPNTSTKVPFSTNECGYQWAEQVLPELTLQFDWSIKDLIPGSTSLVTAFGENCVAADGQVLRFIPMETDFHITVIVEKLDSYETFGNWIAQVMKVVNDIPPGLIAGSNPGFVEFSFETSISESIGFRVSIKEYNEIAVGKTGEELFWLFYTE